MLPRKSEIRAQGLTMRELQTLAYYAMGYRSAAIAELQSCTTGTVEKRLENVAKKLDSTTIVQSVWIARHRLEIEMIDLIDAKE